MKLTFVLSEVDFVKEKGGQNSSPCPSTLQAHVAIFLPESCNSLGIIHYFFLESKEAAGKEGNMRNLYVLCMVW